MYIFNAQFKIYCKDNWNVKLEQEVRIQLKVKYLRGKYFKYSSFLEKKRQKGQNITDKGLKKYNYREIQKK